MLIRIPQFSGEVPRNNPQALPDPCAQQAVDCDFSHNSVRGIRAHDATTLISGSNIKSLFVYDFDVGAGNPFYWSREVDALRSPLASDAYGRFYWCDGTGFKVSDGRVGGNGEPYPGYTYKVGVPRPSSPLTLTTGAMEIPGAEGATISWTLYDERTDGTLFNAEQVYPSKSATLTSLTWSFIARAAQPPTTTATTTSSSSSAGSSTTVSGQTLAPVKGPVLFMTITRTDGSKSVVQLRKLSSDSVWPPEITGVQGSLDASGQYYTVRVGAPGDYQTQRAYTYTYVNQWGEEGPPADPLEVSCADSTSISLRYPPVSASGYCPITRIRVYRTATGTTTNYLFVGEVPIDSSYVFNDAVPTESLGEALSTNYYYPPSQAFSGIAMMANGIMVGFTGNELWFSEPYLPYAWNPSAIKPLPHRIVGVCPFESGLYVTTTANPYFIMGASPDAMTDAKVPVIQGGVSKYAIANLPGGVAYASNDGIVFMRGLDASLDASFRFFTREVWRDKYGSKLAQMRFAVHDGMLVVWFADGTPGFMMRLDESAQEMTQLADPIYGAFVHPVADSLYISIGSAVKVFRAGADRKSFSWWSKEFTLEKPVNLSVAQLNGAGIVTLEVYADGEQRMKQKITLNNYGRTTVRLPSGFMARIWSFKFYGTGDLQEFLAATSMVELQNV